MQIAACLVLSLLLLTTAPAAHALVFVVDTTSNASDALLTDDLCDTGAGQCSLRAAIEQANSTAGADRIEVAIPAPAPVRIEFGFAVVDSPSMPAIDNEIVENRIWGNSPVRVPPSDRP
jgi:hypothetical protein